MTADSPDVTHGFRLVLAPPAPLEDAFLDAVAAVRGRAPLAPVDVLVGGVLQRPYMQRRIAETSPGLVNVRFSTLGELGLRLGEPALAASDRLPLPAIAGRAYAAEVARTATSYFAPVATTPGFADALRRVVRELRQEEIDAALFREQARSVCESEAKADELADLYERYIAGRGGSYDGEDALALADPARFDGIELLLWGIWQLSAVGRRLVAAIAQRVPVTVFLPSVDETADAVHAELRAHLIALDARVEQLAPASPTTPLQRLQTGLFTIGESISADSSFGLVSAPDPLTETREAARTCLGWARDGMPFRDMVVSYREAEIYRPLIEAVFAEANIPVYLDDGPSLAERPLGRRILALLDLIDAPLRRRDVIGFLSDGWMPKATRERYGKAPVARWDSASRRAGVVQGIDQWQQRLTLLRETERKAAEEENAPEWIQQRVDDCDTLLAFVTDLEATLSEHPQQASWREHLTYLRGVLETYVRGADEVCGFLDSLAELDRLLPSVEFSRFLDSVRAEVRALKAGDVSEGQQGAFGRRGVSVLDVNQLRHLRFEGVVVLGLVERSFPPPPRQDPILLDDERERLGIPLRARGADPEPLQFALAAHAARSRLVLSTRRAAEAGGRAQLPSSFFRGAAFAVAGKRVKVDEVDWLPCVRRLRAGRTGAPTLDGALTTIERDRTLLELEPPLGRAVLHGLEPRAVRADRLRRARWQTRTLTTYDGAFESAEAIGNVEQRFLEGYPLSPTGLELYALCPLKYFFENVLRVKPLEEPADVRQIEAHVRGTLVHDVLRALYEQLNGDQLGPESRETLLALTEEKLVEAEQQGLTGSSLLWAADRQQILDDMVGWLELELADGPGLPEHGLEVSFGGRWHDESSPLSSDEPLEVTLPSGQLRLRGRIDRLDYDDDRFRVVDYKTGKGSSLGSGGLSGGRTLQLPLYLLAGAKLIGLDPSVGEAAYHLVSRAGDFRRIAFRGADLATRQAELETVLERVLSGARTGDFHPEPGDHCRWCDFIDVCDVARAAIIERKSADERVVSYRVLKEIP